MAIVVENVKEAFLESKARTIKCLVAGPPGSGKTRSASTWPNVLYADAEGRLLSIRDRDVRRVQILSTHDLDELKAALDQSPEVRASMLGGPVDTVVIDTVDELARIIIRERLRSEKKETMAIQDWGYLADTLRSFLRGFRNLRDLNVIFNVHLSSSRDDESGRVSYGPAIQGQVGDQIAEFVDECFLMKARPTVDPRTGERVIVRYLQTYPDSQHDWIKDHSGALPQEFEINFDDDYARMAKLIFGDIVVADKPQPPVITGELRASVEIEGPPDELMPQTTSSVLGELEKQADQERKAPRKRPSERVKREPIKGTVTVNLPEDDYSTPPEEPAPEAEPEPEAQVEAPAEEEQIRVVPEPGTPTTSGDPLSDLGSTFPCDVCGNPVENVDYQDLSIIRFGKPLCRKHFAERNKK